MNEEKPLLSIGDDGIKINLKKGDTLKTNADKTFMRGVDQNVQGGILEHRATEDLTQIGNKMEASDDGQILNEVVGGKLNQRDNQMKVSKGGTITNRVSKEIKIGAFVFVVISFLADLASLYFFGEHIWNKLF